MANDHYVAQTYLKHFTDESGKLHAFRKSDGKSFPCSPKDICAELDGDTIPDFLTDEKYLGKYRATFESAWNPAIEALQARSLSRENKLHIAGYWANLMICTPTWKRVGIDLFTKHMENTLRARNILAEENGRPEELLAEGIKAIDRGDLKLKVEGDYIRAHAAKHALLLAWKLYNADWQIFENDTETAFITSDNPSTFEDNETWGRRDHPLFLPMTPKLCVTCDLTKQRDLPEKPDFSQKPKGTVTGGPAPLGTIKHINAGTAKSAENLVLCNSESGYAKELAATYDKYGVQNESQMTRQGNLFFIADRVRVIVRNAKSS